VTQLTARERVALADCAKFRPGEYIWKPATMAALGKKGLAEPSLSSSGFRSWRLTQAGVNTLALLTLPRKPRRSHAQATKEA
jgi:hypothetical protein